MEGIDGPRHASIVGDGSGGRLVPVHRFSGSRCEQAQPVQAHEKACDAETGQQRRRKSFCEIEVEHKQRRDLPERSGAVTQGAA